MILIEILIARYFIDNVVRAGKIPGLNYGTLSEMSEEDIEQEYKDYMSNRLAGNTDAMGNPLNTVVMII